MRPVERYAQRVLGGRYAVVLPQGAQREKFHAGEIAACDRLGEAALERTVCVAHREAVIERPDGGCAG